MKRRLMSFVLAAVMMITMLPGLVLESEAATFADINKSEIFLKQSADNTCTLVAAAMMMRRRAIMEGQSNWERINEANLKSVAWEPGLAGSFTYSGIRVTGIIPGGNAKSYLIGMLEKHPEGIVAFNGNHAILVTDYDSTEDKFYCADPAGNSTGRVPLNDAKLLYCEKYGLDTEEKILSSIYHYWYAEGEVELEWGYLSKCSPITPTLAQVTGKSGNLKALPCSIETDPESFAYHSLKGKTFVVDGFCTNSAGNLWYRTSCDCGCGAESAWVYSGDVKVDKILYDIKLSDDAVYPTELVQDNGCNLKGTITTSHRLKEVTISVFKDALFVTEPIYTGTDEIDLKQSYSISYGLDNKIKFSELDPGKYIFEICAVEQIEDPTIQACTTKTHVLLREKLTVSPRNSSSDTLSLSGATYPTSLSVGQWFVLQGTVTSASSKITSVTAGVFNSSGKMVTGKTTAPNSKSYNIHDLDNDVLFDSLSAGTYSYIIRATNASGEKELLNKDFTVGGGDSGSGSTISASGRYSVTNTRNITGQDIVATARQWANEGATYWSHYEPWLPSIYWRTGYTYNGQQSFDCSGFVSRVLNDCGLRSGNYTPPYGDCILSQQYGNGFMSIQIEDLVNYGTDITAAVKRAKNGDYSGLQPGDLIAWTSGSLGRHIIIYAGMKNGTPWTVEFTGGGYRDRAMPAEYQSAFQFGARLVSDAGAACSEHTKGEFLFYEGAHPHYNYYTCATCGEKFSDWTYTRLSDCSDCAPACTNHVKGMHSHCETEHPHYIYYYCNNCEELFKSTSTTKLDTCEICTPKDMMTFSGGTFPTELTRGQRVEISGTVTSANSNLKYVETTVNDLTGKVYFTNKIDVSTKSYDLSKISDTVPFEGLPEGNYNYIVSAANATYSERVYVVRFTVKSELISDVRKGQWYYDAVQYVMKNGIMSGYNATTFGPNDNLSRAMVVQVLYNKEGQPAVSGKHKFPDVPSSQWYNNAVTWGSQRGVVGGYGDGRFGPDDSVTLEQVAVILWNYSKNPAGTGSLSGIKGQYSDWAANALRWCAGKGILNNVPYSNATEKATRAQTAQILTNFLSMPETKAESLTLATGGSSGTWFGMGTALQNMLNGKISKSQLSVISSGGSVDNIHKIEDGEADLAFVAADIIKDAHNGKNSFSSGKETSALWVAGLYPETVQIVATPNITDVSQLRGKVVCMGDVGTSTRVIAEQILSAYGMSINDIVAVSGSFQDGIDGLTSGKVEAAITIAFAPTSAITRLASTNDFNLVSLSNAALERLSGDHLIRNDLPAGTYNGINQNTKCVAVQSALVASEDVSTEVVYELLKAMFNNESALENGHSRFGLLDADQAALNAVSMHPGAQKYYREIGVLK